MTSVNTVRQTLEKAFSSSVRSDVLDVRVHFVPVDVNIYRLVLGNYLRTEDMLENDPGYVASVEQIVAELEEFVVSRHKKPPIVMGDTHSWEEVISNPETRLPALVYAGNGKLAGVLYGSYQKTYNNLFKTFIRNTLVKYLKDSHYEQRRQEKAIQKESGVNVAESDIPKGYDVGHLAGEAPYLASPLLEKLNRLETVLDTLVGTTTGEQQKKIQAISKEVAAARDSLYEKSSYGSKVSGYLEKDVSDFLIKVKAVLVIPQDALENRYFYGNKIEGIIDDRVTRALLDVNFSRNVVEESIHRISSALKGTKLPRATPRKNLGKFNIVPAKPKGTTKVSTPSPGKIPAKPTSKKPATVSNTVSLASLQILINRHLQDVISANMGDGNRRDILNYRTGRLAASAKVEKMSKSREGLITAFYSFMKNPYATFSEGGKQSIPKSRDPKLLIAKSIREIAAERAANKLRAVSV